MATTPKKNDENSTDDLGASEVQAEFDEANEQGYFGTLPESRDGNESYTLAAVTKSK